MVERLNIQREINLWKKNPVQRIRNVGRLERNLNIILCELDVVFSRYHLQYIFAGFVALRRWRPDYSVTKIDLVIKGNRERILRILESEYECYYDETTCYIRLMGVIVPMTLLFDEHIGSHYGNYNGYWCANILGFCYACWLLYQCDENGKTRGLTYISEVKDIIKQQLITENRELKLFVEFCLEKLKYL
jgi:hypothetical protein